MQSKEEKFRWNRSKIFLVSQGNGGKSSLANKMMRKGFQFTSSTMGAEKFETQISHGFVQHGYLEKYEKLDNDLELMLARAALTNTTPLSPHLPKFSGKRTSSIIPEAASPSTCGNVQQIKNISESDNIESVGRSLPIDSEVIVSENVKETAQDEPATFLTVKDIDLDLYNRLFSDHFNKESKIIVSLYDFGGQYIFNVLNQFFMTTHAVYIVVLNMELFLSEHSQIRESCLVHLKYWISSIVMNTLNKDPTNTAFAIVGTRKDKNRSFEDQVQISKTLEHLFGQSPIWPWLIKFNFCQVNPFSLGLLRFTYADGDIYEGDCKHGKGKFTYSSGEVPGGRFENDQFVGRNVNLRSEPGVK